MKYTGPAGRDNPGNDMFWHRQEVFSLKGVLEALTTLVPQLREFQCIVVQLDDWKSLTLTREPCPCIYVMSKFSPTEMDRLRNLSQELGLLTSEGSPSADGVKRFAFYSPSRELNLLDVCPHFLSLLFEDQIKLTVCGVDAKVHKIGFVEDL